MNTNDTPARPRGSRFHIARSRGAASGLLLVLLGIWGALIPFVGPYFNFAYSPDRAWVWTEARGWLEVLPGAVAVVGGLMLLMTRNRATAMLGAWLAVAAGVWFIVGRAFASTLNVGEIGVPAAATPAKTVALELAYFSALGAFIVFLGAAAVGRLSVRTARDLEYAERRVVVDHDEPMMAHDEPHRVGERNGESVPEPTTVRRTRPSFKDRMSDRLHRRHTPVPH
ncbi:hypothetical protein MCHIJ_42920 [Mycolicibacterium chitae]|uniref:Putative secreted protein n=1 Tax=Mycolicibacterium chitae TaxID=1792 RepID=A0A448I7J3_MYCCI|nr:hypothetical protein [Mycolicibacterium chitae]BBZ04855.1 hypothetical protein MCHIJ_42920 [Mycolicibacterium chitae]VEG48479.1 putative secreted protein [Mycolicibacterium chitae]